jgi:glycosyltransferase involved in cell wall biosynthesis
LKAQTYPNIELIIINNNSKDKTEAIAKKLTDKVFTETKQGYIHAVRLGAEKATGDLITFCDADSYYPPEWAAKVAKEFAKNEKTVVVYGTADTHDASKFQNFMNLMGYTTFLLISKLFGLDNTSGFNFVMKKAAYDKVGGYDPAYQKMSPDIELGKRLKKIGKVKFKPSIKVSSSYRRFQDGGDFKTTLMFAKAWWAMVVGKTPDVSYEEYNK